MNGAADGWVRASPAGAADGSVRASPAGAVDRRGPTAPAEPRPALLAYRALGLGDLLTGLPAVRGLRRAYGGHRLVLGCPAALAPLALLSGAVDEVLPVPGPGAAGHLDPPDWPGPPPDLAVNLHGRGPESHRALLSLLPQRLLAFAHSSFPQVDGPAWPEDEHEVRRWCRLLAHYGVTADPADLDLPRPAGRRSPAPGAVLVHPGAAYPARRWPPDRFAAVAAALRRAGHRVVVTGDAPEHDLAAAVAAGAGVPDDDIRAGRTDLLDLAALVADARLLICGDTGVGHLATAYRTPSVLLFGPSLPARWGPPADRAEHAVRWHGEDEGDARADRPDPALLRIGPDEVIAAALALLAEPARPAEPARASAAVGAVDRAAGELGAPAAS